MYKKEFNNKHFIKKQNTDEVGYYNGGCVWTKNKNVPLCWKKHTVNSRFVDQASLEDVALDYKHSMFKFLYTIFRSFGKSFKYSLNKRVFS